MLGEIAEIALRGALMGVGATAILDLFNLLQQRAFKAPVPDWGMVGRWIGHFPRGQFTHPSIAKAAPVAGERAIGWLAHYCIGIAFATIAILVWGLDWARHPTFLPALIVGIIGV